MRKFNLNVGGTIVPLLTPVTAGGDVDHDGLMRLTSWLVEKGVGGLFVAGTTGRFSHFSPQQNARICRTVSGIAGGHITIYGGACDSGIFRILDNAKMMEEAGADVVVTTGPFYLPYAIDEVEASLRRVAEESPCL